MLLGFLIVVQSLPILQSEACPFFPTIAVDPAKGVAYVMSSNSVLNRGTKQTLFEYRRGLSRKALAKFTSSRLVGTDEKGMPVLESDIFPVTIGKTGIQRLYDQPLAPSLENGIWVQRIAGNKMVVSWPQRPLLRFGFDDRYVKLLTNEKSPWGEIAVSPKGDSIAIVSDEPDPRILITARSEDRSKDRWLTLRRSGGSPLSPTKNLSMCLLDGATALVALPDTSFQASSNPLKDHPLHDSQQDDNWIVLCRLSLETGEVEPIRRFLSDTSSLIVKTLDLEGSFLVCDYNTIYILKDNLGSDKGTK